MGGVSQGQQPRGVPGRKAHLGSRLRLSAEVCGNGRKKRKQRVLYIPGTHEPLGTCHRDADPGRRICTVGTGVMGPSNGVQVFQIQDLRRSALQSKRIDDVDGPVDGKDDSAESSERKPTGALELEAIAAADLAAVARVLEGEVRAYDEIVGRHEASLRRVVIGIVADPHGAEDVLQEVFLIAYRKLQGFRGEAPFGAWLYRIAVREARRSRSKWRKILRKLAPLEVAEEQARRDFVSAAEPLDAELGKALELLHRLPQRARAAFVLHIVEGLSYEEIAEVLQCGSGTVGSLIHRARARLAQMTGNDRGMPRDGRIPTLEG